MILSRKSWYSKVYFFTESWWSYSGGNNYSGKQFEEGKITNSDICTFMRAFILKLPLLVAIHAFMAWLTFFVFLHLPIHYLGFTGYFTAILVIVGFIAMCIGAYYGEKKVSAYLKAKDAKPARTTPTFWDLSCAWVKAKHDRICLLMTFADEEEIKDD